MAFRQMAGEREGGIGVLSTDHDASLKTALALGSGCVCPVDREGRAVPEKWESMCAGGVSGVSGPIMRQAHCRMRRFCVPPPGNMEFPCIWI